MERLQAVVSGEVQGVGFRDFIERQARTLGLAGWVRNEEDGTVQVVAEGPREALEALTSRLSEGPRLARVAEVETRWEPAQAEFRSFSVRY